ncbi:hypothetical protein ACODM8_01190 [Vibrio ostreicida]|uniref:hypothetical protein n=1 Tax=Vibrio ostreicida TaxID=526588 RepID=UPI0009711F0D|nr:hypothetical protein [Vibrio ostreicida]
MFQAHSENRPISKFNVLAQPTQPMMMPPSTLNRLAGLSHSDQWILFTAECPRPDYNQFSSYKVLCKKILQMKPSQRLSEVDIVAKAIKSGNASAIVASDNITQIERSWLHNLANQYHCEVFFVESGANHYH